MNAVIKIDGLSKRYALQRNMPRYSSLRDELTQRTRDGIGRLLGRSRPENSPTEEFWALKDVSLSIGQGDRVGVIGRNGAGKSTLLKILSRITDPTEGSIDIVGRVSSLLEVGTGFHPELSGRENIYLNGAILGMRKDEISRKFDDIVQFAEVERFLDTPVKRYSSGMYVRLAFAVAAHLEPDVLIVDEVLAVGDAQFQQKCLGRMEELSRDGRTILFVTHNMDAMLALCNRAVILNKGKMVFDGSPTEARQSYLTQVSSVEYSVAKNAGRGGSGGVYVNSVWLEGTQSHAIISGEPISLCIEATVTEQYEQRTDLQVAFGIDMLDGQRIFTVLSSWEGGEPILSSYGRIAVRCDIPQFPVVPGRYLVSATILFRGDTLDSVQHCASFDVLPRDRPVHVERMQGWGPMDLKCQFNNI
jgi:lipopolysaccharide transport system ATP-binding protein